MVREAGGLLQCDEDVKFCFTGLALVIQCARTGVGGIWAGPSGNKFPAKLLTLPSPVGLLQAINTDSQVLFHKTQSSLRTIQILDKCFELKMMQDYLVPGLFSTNALNSK